jgi:hypothetical protein
MNLKTTTKAAIAKYGLSNCVEAAHLCDVEGEGASTIAQYLGLKGANGSIGTRQADAAINAGREIIGSLKPILDESGVEVGEGDEVVAKTSRHHEVVKIRGFMNPRLDREGQPFEIEPSTLVRVTGRDGLLGWYQVKDLCQVNQ